MNGSDTGWFLHTDHETKRRTESGQAVVKDRKETDGHIFVVFAAWDGHGYIFCSPLNVECVEM